MQEQLVSFEVAQLLKDKGFDLECLHFYCKNNTCNYLDIPTRYSFEVNANQEQIRNGIIDNFGYGLTWSAPTQSLAQKWLREVHNIHISVWFNTLTEKYRPESPNDNLDFIIGNNGEFKTYEEALEFSLKQALILIKDELNNN